MIISDRNTPRWIIFLIDIVICAISLYGAFLLRFDFNIPQAESDRFYIVFPYVIGVRVISFFISRIYRGIIRYTSSKDAGRIFIVTTAGSAFIFFSNFLAVTLFNSNLYLVPRSIVIIDYLAVTFMMISLRIIFKSIYFELKNPTRDKRSVIIFGAGEAGIITKRTLDRDAGSKYRVIAFVDDNKNKAGKNLEGVRIYSGDKLNELLTKNDVAHLIISVQHISPKRKEELVDICLPYKTKVLNVPPVNNWINGELSFKQIRKVNIEELLERDSIKLDEANISKQLKGKTILVTGAAGSIGSELARQIIKYSPSKTILLDQAESPLYDIEMELSEKQDKQYYEVVIADIRNTDRLENVFKTFKPAIVFHAAAYKHVPMMENNPSEAILTNVLGTQLLANLSVKYNVEKFVMISTDKAVNPTGIMGASKRIAEIYIQSLNKTCNTKFITTRFGNVLGSSGSVIPRFRQQIEKGGPVTITHPDITRYFMTIPEACQLVLEAGAMGNGGEIYIFDMGKSVKIIDLAKKMIQLSGLTLDKDIKIVYTGLRPGEKLYEELLNDKENTIPTHHPQIMIAKVREYDYETVRQNISQLLHLFGKQDNKEIVLKMKEIVPEYKSNNSVYETLDKNLS